MGASTWQVGAGVDTARRARGTELAMLIKGHEANCQQIKKDKKIELTREQGGCVDAASMVRAARPVISLSQVGNIIG